MRDANRAHPSFERSEAEDLRPVRRRSGPSLGRQPHQNLIRGVGVLPKRPSSAGRPSAARLEGAQGTRRPAPRRVALPAGNLLPADHRLAAVARGGVRSPSEQQELRSTVRTPKRDSAGIENRNRLVGLRQLPAGPNEAAQGTNGKADDDENDQQRDDVVQGVISLTAAPPRDCSGQALEDGRVGHSAALAHDLESET